MKIALIVPGGVDRSGTHRVIPALLWLIERLAARDTVHVFALQQEPRPATWPLLGATVHNAGRRPRRLRALGQMLAEHRRGRFDIVHAFWAGGPGVVAAMFRRLTGVPAVLTLPGGDLVAMPDIGYGARLSWRGRFWTNRALAGASRIIVPSDWMGAEARKLGVATTTLPYGVALDRWPVREPARRMPGAPLRLIHVANLNRVKDQETLLLALAMLDAEGLDFQLDIVGEDTLGGHVQRRCTALGLDARVRFHGFRTQEALRPLMEQVDLMVVSSRHEGVPIAVLEAAITGVPTVGTAVGQIDDWAPNAALAVPIGDSEALAKAIARVARDEELRLSLASEAQRRAVAHDADRFAAETRALYTTHVANP